MGSDDPKGQNIDCERATAVLDCVADGVFTVDADWRISFFNKAAEQITGMRREDVIGKPCREIFEGEQSGKARLRQILAAERAENRLLQLLIPPPASRPAATPLTVRSSS